MTNNIGYRLWRFLGAAESGVVERVETLSQQELQKTFLRQPMYPKDDSGNFPKRIFFKNPLGELVSEIAPLITRAVDSSLMNCQQVYLEYKPEDRYP